MLGRGKAASAALWSYYTLTPRSGHNKTAVKAVLQGSMFTKQMCKAHPTGHCPVKPLHRRFGVIIPCFKEVFEFVKKFYNFALLSCLASKIPRKKQ